jgi:thiamine pyrophosphokinase
LHALIFANGSLNLPPGGLAGLPHPHLIIAADGGCRHCLALGLRPDLVVGDLDSLDAGDQRALETAGVELLRFPVRKDFTDLELALQVAQQRGVQEMTILGGLGGRWDQSIANLLLLAAPQFAGLRLHLLDGPTRLSLLRGGQSLALSGAPGDTLSLIPLSPAASGITTTGLEYPLSGGALQLGSTTGVSNVLTAPQASVALTVGLLLCVFSPLTS